MKINRISPQSSKYLQIISTIAKSPEKLHFIGKLPSERMTTVAIVGSRKPTAYGKEVTHKFAYELASRGIIIISGLALGVDAIAHRAALEAGGKTIAVLANGVDTIYPANHKSLANDIINSDGAIISEYEPGIAARSFQFLARNRIVSGLSDAVIVTEAAIRSGTLSTVSHALEQGREVFVVPGNITSPLSAGCNNLIKQGAHPITCVEDILEIIAPNLLQPQSILALGANPQESIIIELLQSGIRDGDELQYQSSIDASEFAQTLTMMEINGKIRGLGGNQWTLR
ncbi:DNA-protecting protein DprA [Candidatus Saccharibacteria bacterium HGW-Saccharibacteria-1]|jgi:DNA processing protein|nr:MAG: DNA-protecting protein DprA [Candidatus Saccharibacteria bacterium HGW-Saccharibacteria-1]